MPARVWDIRYKGVESKWTSTGVSAYATDRWELAPKATLNLGVRFDFDNGLGRRRGQRHHVGQRAAARRAALDAARQQSAGGHGRLLVVPQPAAARVPRGRRSAGTHGHRVALGRPQRRSAVHAVRAHAHRLRRLVLRRRRGQHHRSRLRRALRVGVLHRGRARARRVAHAHDRRGPARAQRRGAREHRHPALRVPGARRAGRRHRRRRWHHHADAAPLRAHAGDVRARPLYARQPRGAPLGLPGRGHHGGSRVPAPLLLPVRRLGLPHQEHRDEPRVPLHRERPGPAGRGVPHAQRPHLGRRPVVFRSRVRDQALGRLSRAGRRAPRRRGALPGRPAVLAHGAHRRVLPGPRPGDGDSARRRSASPTCSRSTPRWRRT